MNTNRQRGQRNTGNANRDRRSRGRGRDTGAQSRQRVRREEPLWTPRTRLGEMVKEKKITTQHDLMEFDAPIKEVEIVDTLFPDMREEIIDVGRVQRVTDSGRRMRFRVVAAVGNGNGYVGVGEAKGKDAGSTIRSAIKKAKLGIKEINRGCGSWECGCKESHTVPFRVKGKCGSVEVTLFPAPKGVGLVSGEIAKKILSLAGISDIWVHTEGHARTSINSAHALLNALVNTRYMKVKNE